MSMKLHESPWYQQQPCGEQIDILGGQGHYHPRKAYHIRTAVLANQLGQNRKTIDEYGLDFSRVFPSLTAVDTRLARFSREMS
jgi:hypothetical protein